MNDVRRGLMIAFGVLIVLGGAYLVYLLRSVLALLFLSIIVAQVITPAVQALKRRGIGLTAALLTIYATIAVAIGLLGWQLESTVGADFSNGVAALGELRQQLQTAASSSSVPFLRGLLDGLGRMLGRLVNAISGTPRESVNEVRGVTTSVLYALAVLVFAYYWVVERATLQGTLLQVVPSRYRIAVRLVWEDVEHQLGAWARGELLLMLCIALPFGIALALLGVRYAVVLALFAGIVGIVPVIGSVIGPAPAVIVALPQGFRVALPVLVIGVAVQLIEGIVIGPRLMSRVTGVAPLTVLLGIIAGASVAGVLGALLAIPLAVSIQIVFRHLRGLDNEVATADPQDLGVEEVVTGTRAGSC